MSNTQSNIPTATAQTGQAIPMFSPTKELERIGYDNIQREMDKVLKSGTYISGPGVVAFEEAAAEYMGAKYAIAVSSGTMALELGLKAIGLSPKESVTINTNTFVAVAEAIIAAGGTPDLVDTDGNTWQMPKVATSNIVLASHLYGNASNAIQSNTKLLMEDASQSFGARLNGKLLGTFAPITAVSLYPTKNLSANGDAGIIFTHNEDYAQKCKALRNHGQSGYQVHQYCGTTGRMDDLLAVVLKLKLAHFDSFIQERRHLAVLYTQKLKGTPLQLPVIESGLEPATNLFVVRTPHRDALKQHLTERQIGCGIHYPTPIHQMPAYASSTWAQKSLPEAELLAKETLSLPIWVGMTEEQVTTVCNEIYHFFDATKRS